MRKAPFVAATVVVAALAACAGIHRRAASEDLAAAVAGPADAPPRAYFTGDTAGLLSPCGCEFGQYGGLARRATYLRRIRRPGDLAVDLGNLVVGDGPTQQVVLSYSLDGLTALGYDAFVPGEGEVRMGAFFEDAVRGRAAPRVVCANLLRADDGAAVFEPWMVHPLADGRTVAVVGVVEPFAGVPSRYRVAPVEDAVHDAMKRLHGKADVVVVAGALRDEATLALASKCPDAALVVGGWATFGSDKVMKTSGAPAMLVGQFAEFVGRVDFDASMHVRDAHLAWLDDGVPDDPDAAGLVARYKAEISQQGGEFKLRLVASLREQSYVGSAACAECHEAEAATWTASRHSHAMRTLVAKKSERDPQCIVCHLADVPTLLTDEAPSVRDRLPTPPTDSLGVGCEACHGGGARHVEFAQRGKTADAVAALANAGRAACLRCHIPPNATRFDFERDWPKIAHGRGAAK
jgi:2',3'-cyclic-nucleotide 2'-phosphodiesterase (5'-nucleotidase family)